MNKFSKLIIVLFLGSILSISLPVTYSYFTHEEDTSLVYKAQIYNLYSEDDIENSEVGSNESKAILKITFKPIDYTEATSEEYEVVIPSTCTFSNFDILATYKKVDDTHTIIKYSKDTNRKKNNTITLSCNITPNKDINLAFKVNGNINNQKFLYNKYTYEETYQNYIEKVSDKVLDKVVLKSDNLYTEFITWIEKYAEQEGYSQEILVYVKDKYPNKEALVNLNDVLLGLNITKNNDEYTISITDNFIGYAMTYCNYLLYNGAESLELYFSTINNSTLNTAFKNYLKIYVYPAKDNLVNLVYDYVYKNNQIKSVITDNKTIDGLKLQNYDSKKGNSAVVIYKSIILSNASLTLEGSSVLVAFGSYSRMIQSFQNVITNKYSSIPLDILKQIYTKAEIQASVTKNNTSTTSTPQNFNDYFVHQNGSEYILINISYNTSNSLPGNNVLLTTLQVKEGTTLTFDNNDTSLTVNINAKSEADAMDAVSKLNNYLNKNITSNDIEVVTNTENNYSIKYTVTK